MVQPTDELRKAASNRMQEVLELEKTLLRELAEAKELALKELAELRAAIAKRPKLAQSFQAGDDAMEAADAAREAAADAEEHLRKSAEVPTRTSVASAPILRASVASATAGTGSRATAGARSRASDRSTVRFADVAESAEAVEAVTPESTDTNQAMVQEVAEACEEVARTSVVEPAKQRTSTQMSTPKYGEQQSFEDFLMDNPEMGFDFDDLTVPTKPVKKPKAAEVKPEQAPDPTPDVFLDDNPEMAFDFDDLMAPAKPKKKPKAAAKTRTAPDHLAEPDLDRDPFLDHGVSATPHSQREDVEGRGRSSTFAIHSARLRSSTTVSEDYNVWTRTVAEVDQRPARRSELEQISNLPTITSRREAPAPRDPEEDDEDDQGD